MGILIAVEGTDSSGKQTQSEMLYKRLSEMGIKSRLVSFPAYESESSALVKMYLAGEFGENPNDVNAYAASTFYAVDRFATFRNDWGKDYEAGVVIIADRYVPSNIIHQAAKLEESEKEAFVKWLSELEYGHFMLPKPNVTFFLDMPTKTAISLMANRANKIDKSGKKDIHERNSEYLKKSYDNAMGIAKRLGWEIVPCTEGESVRDILSINNDMMSVINSIL